MFVHAQAPVRIGIAGGGTDLPAWTRERIGYCLSLAINTYTHAVAITRPDGQVVASYSHLDRAACATEIANGLIRESALLHGWEDGFEVPTMSEVPSHGSGLGVSSSIAVCLSVIFSRMKAMERGWDFSHDRAAIAECAWEVEIDRLRRPIGRQDHMAAAHGGLRLYAFEKDGARIERSFTEEDAKWVAKHVVILPLPDGHDARAILANVKSPATLQHAYDAVPVAVSAIESRDLQALGRAVEMGQRSKLGIPGAVPEDVQRLVQKITLVSGVHGVNIAGGGGGGHLVVVCDSEAIDSIRNTTGMTPRKVDPDFHGVRSEGCFS